MSLHLMNRKHKNKIMVTRNNRLFGGFKLATTNTGRLKSKCGTGDIVLAQPKCYGEYVRSLKNCGSCVDSKVIGSIKNAPNNSSSQYLEKKKSCVIRNDPVKGQHLDTTFNNCLGHQVKDVNGNVINSKCNNKINFTKELMYKDAGYVVEKRKAALRKCKDDGINIDGVDMPNNSCSA